MLVLVHPAASLVTCTTAASPSFPVEGTVLCDRRDLGFMGPVSGQGLHLGFRLQSRVSISLSVDLPMRVHVASYLAHFPKYLPRTLYCLGVDKGVAEGNLV